MTPYASMLKSTAPRCNVERKVLDAFAVLAWMQGESAAQRVRELLSAAESGNVELLMSVVNAGEVFYRLSRVRSVEAAEAFRQAVQRDEFPVTWMPATDGRIWGAAAIKARHPLSYADAFAVALSQEWNAPVVTDDPEIVALSHVGILVEPLTR